MRKTFLALLAFLLAGCVGTPPRTSDIAHHDFGAGPDAPLAVGIPLAALEVRAAPWLDTPALHYRLAYADATRRQAYAGSRWAAAPATLLERHLRRRIMPDRPGGCRLDVALDELEQRFDNPRSSQVVLEARAALLPPRGATALAQRAFLVRKAAPTPDAKGGVQATRAVADALAGELAQWLGAVARERPQAAAVCKEP